jgi:hypothetical protein
MFRLLVSGVLEVSFRRPKPVEVVIWDETGAQSLLEAIDPPSYHILKVRTQIYLHPLIIWRTLISGLSGPGAHYGSVIEYCKPRTVVTFIDNSPEFHRMASRFPDVSFIAFQNGVRTPDYPDRPPHLGAPVRYNSTQLCWGQNEIDFFNARGHQFKEIKAMGSLQNTLFYRAFHDSTKSVGDIYDLVLISTYRKKYSEEIHPLLAYVAYEKVVFFLRSYLESHDGLRVCVAMASGSDDAAHDSERLFHEKLLGNLASLVPKSADAMSSYLTTEQSNVVVSASSALGIESLARGRKTLMCNDPLAETFVGQPFFPDWILRHMDQETFDMAIKKLLAISQEDFLLRNKNSMEYFIVPPHENSISEIRKEVLG